MPSNNQPRITSTHDIQEIDIATQKPTILSPSSSFIDKHHTAPNAPSAATSPNTNQSEPSTKPDELGENATADAVADVVDTDDTKDEPECVEDRYMPLILEHIGSFSEYTAMYTKSERVIGRGAECTVYAGCTNQSVDSDDVAILEYQLSSKLQLVDWFAKYLTIKQCEFYSVYEAFMAHPREQVPALTEFTVYLVCELLHENVTQMLSHSAQQHRKNAESESEQQGGQQSGCINMDEAHVQAMVFQIVQQLDVLTTSHNQCHLDIKPTNIMRRRPRKAQSSAKHDEYTLIDFGFAMECNTSYDGYVGTKEWSAPEMKPIDAASAEPANVIHPSTDMWSVGLLVLYCLYDGRHPLMAAQSTQSDTLQSIQTWYSECVQGKQCFIESWLGKQLMLNRISYHVFDFMFKCLRFDPGKRLTPNQALRHKWLACMQQC